MTDTNSYDQMVTEVSKVVGEKGLNLLINNAGVTTKFTKINMVKPEQLLHNLTVNTVAPIILTKVSVYFMLFDFLPCDTFIIFRGAPVVAARKAYSINCLHYVLTKCQCLPFTLQVY